MVEARHISKEKNEAEILQINSMKNWFNVHLKNVLKFKDFSMEFPEPENLVKVLNGLFGFDIKYNNNQNYFQQLANLEKCINAVHDNLPIKPISLTPINLMGKNYTPSMGFAWIIIKNYQVVVMKNSIYNTSTTSKKDQIVKDNNLKNIMKDFNNVIPELKDYQINSTNELLEQAIYLVEKNDYINKFTHESDKDLLQSTLHDAKVVMKSSNDKNNDLQLVFTNLMTILNLLKSIANTETISEPLILNEIDFADDLMQLVDFDCGKFEYNDIRSELLLFNQIIIVEKNILNVIKESLEDSEMLGIKEYSSEYYVESKTLNLVFIRFLQILSEELLARLRKHHKCLNSHQIIDSEPTRTLIVEMEEDSNELFKQLSILNSNKNINSFYGPRIFVIILEQSLNDSPQLNLIIFSYLQNYFTTLKKILNSLSVHHDQKKARFNLEILDSLNKIFVKASVKSIELEDYISNIINLINQIHKRHNEQLKHLLKTNEIIDFFSSLEENIYKEAFACSISNDIGLAECISTNYRIKYDELSDEISLMFTYKNLSANSEFSDKLVNLSERLSDLKSYSTLLNFHLFCLVVNPCELGENDFILNELTLSQPQTTSHIIKLKEKVSQMFGTHFKNFCMHSLQKSIVSCFEEEFYSNDTGNYYFYYPLDGTSKKFWFLPTNLFMHNIKQSGIMVNVELESNNTIMIPILCYMRICLVAKDKFYKSLMKIIQKNGLLNAIFEKTTHSEKICSIINDFFEKNFNTDSKYFSRKFSDFFSAIEVNMSSYSVKNTQKALLVNLAKQACSDILIGLVSFDVNNRGEFSAYKTLIKIREEINAQYKLFLDCLFKLESIPNVLFNGLNNAEETDHSLLLENNIDVLSNASSHLKQNIMEKIVDKPILELFLDPSFESNYKKILDNYPEIPQKAKKIFDSLILETRNCIVSCNETLQNPSSIEEITSQLDKLVCINRNIRLKEDLEILGFEKSLFDSCIDYLIAFLNERLANKIEMDKCFEKYDEMKCSMKTVRNKIKVLLSENITKFFENSYEFSTFRKSLESIYSETAQLIDSFRKISAETKDEIFPDIDDEIGVYEYLSNVLDILDTKIVTLKPKKIGEVFVNLGIHSIGELNTIVKSTDLAIKEIKTIEDVQSILQIMKTIRKSIEIYLKNVEYISNIYRTANENRLVDDTMTDRLKQNLKKIYYGIENLVEVLNPKIEKFENLVASVHAETKFIQHEFNKFSTLEVESLSQIEESIKKHSEFIAELTIVNKEISIDKLNAYLTKLKQLREFYILNPMINTYLHYLSEFSEKFSKEPEIPLESYDFKTLCKHFEELLSMLNSFENIRESTPVIDIEMKLFYFKQQLMHSLHSRFRLLEKTKFIPYIMPGDQITKILKNLQIENEKINDFLAIYFKVFESWKNSQKNSLTLKLEAYLTSRNDLSNSIANFINKPNSREINVLINAIQQTCNNESDFSSKLKTYKANGLSTSNITQIFEDSALDTVFEPLISFLKWTKNDSMAEINLRIRILFPIFKLEDLSLSIKASIAVNFKKALREISQSPEKFILLNTELIDLLPEYMNKINSTAFKTIKPSIINILATEFINSLRKLSPSNEISALVHYYKPLVFYYYLASMMPSDSYKTLLDDLESNVSDSLRKYSELEQALFDFEKNYLNDIIQIIRTSIIKISHSFYSHLTEQLEINNGMKPAFEYLVNLKEEIFEIIDVFCEESDPESMFTFNENLEVSEISEFFLYLSSRLSSIDNEIISDFFNVINDPKLTYLASFSEAIIGLFSALDEKNIDKLLEDTLEIDISQIIRDRNYSIKLGNVVNETFESENTEKTAAKYDEMIILIKGIKCLYINEDIIDKFMTSSTGLEETIDSLDIESELSPDSIIKLNGISSLMDLICQNKPLREMKNNEEIVFQSVIIKYEKIKNKITERISNYLNLQKEVDIVINKIEETSLKILDLLKESKIKPVELFPSLKSFLTYSEILTNSWTILNEKINDLKINRESEMEKMYTETVTKIFSNLLDKISEWSIVKKLIEMKINWSKDDNKSNIVFEISKFFNLLQNVCKSRTPKRFAVLNAKLDSIIENINEDKYKKETLSIQARDPQFLAMADKILSNMKSKKIDALKFFKELLTTHGDDKKSISFEALIQSFAEKQILDISDEECKLLLNGLDLDKDGRVDLFEFCYTFAPDELEKIYQSAESIFIGHKLHFSSSKCSCAKKFYIRQVEGNKYMFGDKTLMVRMLKSSVMVRVGGGWMELEEYLDKKDPCRSSQLSRK